MTIRIMARIVAHSHSAVALGEILRELAEPTRAEQGCTSYEVFQNEDNLAEFITVEDWASSAAADAHMMTPHVRQAIAKAMPLLSQPPAIHRFKKIA